MKVVERFGYYCPIICKPGEMMEAYHMINSKESPQEVQSFRSIKIGLILSLTCCFFLFSTFYIHCFFWYETAWVFAFLLSLFIGGVTWFFILFVTGLYMEQFVLFRKLDQSSGLPGKIYSILVVVFMFILLIGLITGLTLVPYLRVLPDVKNRTAQEKKIYQLIQPLVGQVVSKGIQSCKDGGISGRPILPAIVLKGKSSSSYLSISETNIVLPSLRVATEINFPLILRKQVQLRDDLEAEYIKELPIRSAIIIVDGFHDAGRQHTLPTVGGGMISLPENTHALLITVVDLESGCVTYRNIVHGKAWVRPRIPGPGSPVTIVGSVESERAVWPDLDSSIPWENPISKIN
jgi:hypothetical protein